MKKQNTLRYPVVSGLFYPDTEEELRRTVDGYLERVDIDSVYKNIVEQTKIENPQELYPEVIIAPHAGYIFSGMVQAFSFSILTKKKIDTVVIIGPSHQIKFKGVSVNLDHAYQTPLGLVEVDLEFCNMLMEHCRFISLHEEAHLSEHAVEVQLPFIQRVIPEAKIVPILTGEQNWETALILKEAILTTMKKQQKKVVIIVSSDLSHYHSHTEASAMDKLLIDDLRSIRPEVLYENIKSGNSEACGYCGILTGLMITSETGLGRCAILKYIDSGEVSGDKKSVVGYLSAVIY